MLDNNDVNILLMCGWNDASQTIIDIKRAKCSDSSSLRVVLNLYLSWPTRAKFAVIVSEVDVVDDPLWISPSLSRSFPLVFGP